MKVHELKSKKSIANMFKNIKEFKKIVTDYDKGNFVNININSKGEFTKRRGWRTFEGMVRVLSAINRRYQKYDMKGYFTITLPIPYRRKK